MQSCGRAAFMKFNRTEQLLAYLAKNHSEATVTVLMKLAYLVDLSSIEENNKSVSSFKYRRYNYGPFDESIYTHLKKLVYQNVLTQEIGYGSGSAEYIVYRFNEGNPTNFNFKKIASKITIIDKVISALRGYGARTLTEIAYKTKPMRKLGATLGGNENMNKKLNLRTK